MRAVFLLAIPLLLGCKPEPVDSDTDEPEQPHLALVITEPAPASWLGEGPVAVRGTVENLGDVRVDGLAASAADGTFGAETTLERGIHLIEASGVSGAGTTYRTHVGVMAGETGEPDAPVSDAAEMRLNEAGLDLALDVAADLLDGEAIESALVAANPVYELDDGETHVTVDVTSFALGGADLDVDPGDGEADLTVTLTDVSIGVFVDGTRGSFFFSVNQTATVRTAVLTAKVGVSVEDGRIATPLSDVDVVLTGFSLDTSDWPSWLTGSFTDALLTEMAESALRYAIVQVLPPVIEEQLNSLELSFELTLLERNARVSADLTDAAFDPDGLALQVDLDAQIDGVQPVSAPGYLLAPTSSPTVDRTSALASGLSDDLLNLLAFEAWRAGMLSYSLSTEDGSLPPYILDALGGARSGIVRIEADLPPAIVEVDGTLRAQLGELRVRLDTVDGENGSYVIMAVGGHVDLVLQVVDGVLTVGFGDKDLRLTVRDTDWTGSLVQVTEQIEGILPLEVALSLLTDIEFPLPTMAGLAVDQATVTRDASGFHTDVAVELVRVEE